MKIIVLGAGGIIGQHMRLCIPQQVDAVFYRRKPDRFHEGLDFHDRDGVFDELGRQNPDVIVNLAGIAKTDYVERHPSLTQVPNVTGVKYLAEYCSQSGCHLVQISSQAVFSGREGEYAPDSPTAPVNRYGKQKVAAEEAAMLAGSWTILRPTFVLGVRPLPHIGRPNPVEVMSCQESQVNDRWFSVSFADDVARQIWQAATRKISGWVQHLGIPGVRTRYEIACSLGIETRAAGHREFEGFAPRPINTGYAVGAISDHDYESGMREILLARVLDGLQDRAREISLFFGTPYYDCVNRVGRGFAWNHAEVARDFNRSRPKTPDELLDWYRATESYIWELSAYHLDSGFNYAGKCAGIAERLRATGSKNVLCLGDGIGSLTLALRRAGIRAVYHDLKGSRTAEFARFRYWRQTGRDLPCYLTTDWQPEFGHNWDAIVSLDFFEHLPDVEGWMRQVAQALRPGGWLCAQNAFAIGSGPDGSIPCHLEINDHYQHDWIPLLASLGFRQENDNWYQHP